MARSLLAGCALHGEDPAGSGAGGLFKGCTKCREPVVRSEFPVVWRYRGAPPRLSRGYAPISPAFPLARGFWCENECPAPRGRPGSSRHPLPPVCGGERRAKKSRPKQMAERSHRAVISPQTAPGRSRTHATKPLMVRRIVRTVCPGSQSVEAACRGSVGLAGIKAASPRRATPL